MLAEFFDSASQSKWASFSASLERNEESVRYQKLLNFVLNLYQYLAVAR